VIEPVIVVLAAVAITAPWRGAAESGIEEPEPVDS
jgi:hypothetical protein